MLQKQGWWDRTILEAGLKRWRRAAQEAGTAALPDLRSQRAAARRLKAQIDRLLHVADSRLALPLTGNQTFPRPDDADWAWRPELWCGPLPGQGVSGAPSGTMLGEEATLFHDCPRAEMTLRQLRNRREADLAACGLRLDVLEFAGSYLSLVLDCPAGACDGLRRKHLIRLESLIETEMPAPLFARLNIRHGPNTEQILRALPHQEDRVSVEFDLAYTKLNEKRVERMWLDLIFEAPRMNSIILRDLTLSRRRRAEL